FDLLGDLYTMPIAGGAAAALTSGMAYDAQPRFSPDGKLVVFTSDRDGGDNVWTIDLDTKATKQITRGKASRYRSPEWTPDGNSIVVSRAPGPIGPSKPWIFHKDGGSGIQLVRDPAPLPAGTAPVSMVGAAFGNDDRYIWFAQRNGAWEYNAAFPQYSLVTFDRQTGRRDARANLLGGGIRPALSADGKWLAYGSRYEAQTGLRLRDLESGEEKWLAYPIQRDEQESVASLDALPGYSFTPDSRAVIISFGGKIWRVPVDGTAQSPIPFRVQASIGIGPKLAFNYRISDSAEFTVKQIRDAVPSPDGRRMAFVALDRVYAMDWPGGTPRRLSDVNETQAQPAWSPDGQWIAYVSWSRDGGQVHKVPAAGGAAVRLTQSRAMYSTPVWSPDGNRVVVMRAPAQPVLEEGSAAGSGAELVWVPAAGGATTLIAPSTGRTGPHFARDTNRIYLNSGGALVSVRWNGTDERTHVRVTGARGPEATAASTASLVRLSPQGDQVLAQVANDLFVFPLVEAGEPATVGLASPDNAEVPVRRLTDIGGQFPAWSRDGTRVHFSIGNAHVVYDLTRARQFDDSVAAARAAAPGGGAGGAAGAGAAGGAGPGGQAAAQATPPRYEPTETRVLVRARRDTPEGVAIFRNARIITMKGAEVIANGDIVVRNNRIVGIGRRGTVQIPAGARTIDLSGKTVVPGFVDTHAHLGLRSGIHQQPWSYIANLAYGVTTTRDPQTGTTDVLSYEDLVQAGMATGPRVYSTGPGLFSLVYQPGSGEEIRDQEHARRVM
ncbi:MAG: amidohydrolase, partial [Gemmatimonadetes bacterium]|nr:amidohydrolase [Gemmatimonadota bacterium]